MPKPPDPPKRPKLPEVKAAPAPIKRNKDDNWTIKFRVRTYASSEQCDIWLLKNCNGVTSALLYGQLYKKTAILLIEKSGIDVDWEERPYEYLGTGLTQLE